ncbi:MAG: TonB-dependent receptor [Bacteroidetes bacterium]|nr:TonB-dependent receptor [Bacteroidota bacterium]
MIDAADDAPLPGINVALVGTMYGTATDAEGQFELTSVPAGDYDLRVSGVGYQTFQVPIVVQAQQTTRLRIELQEEAVSLEELEVVARAADRRLATSVAPRTLDEQPVQDLAEGLRGLAGLNLQRRGALALDPNVRGLTGTQVGTLVDGMRSFGAGPARMDTPLSHVDPATVEQMSVVRGPYALALGGTLSTLDVQTRSTVPQGPFTGALATGFAGNRNAADVNGHVMGRAGRAFYDIGGAYRTGDDYTAGDGSSVRGEFMSAEVRGRFGFEPTSTSRLTARLSYQDQRDVAYVGRPLDADFFETIRGSLKYRRAGSGLAPVFTVQAYGYQTLHLMNNDNKPTAQPNPDRMPPFPLNIFNNTEIATVGGRSTVVLQPSPRLTLDVGLEGYTAFRTATRVRARRDTGDILGEDIVWGGVRTTEVGGFVQAERSIGRADITGTARLDVAHMNPARVSQGFLDRANTTADALDQTDALWSLAVSASVPVTNTVTLTAGAGSAARVPESLERYGDRMGATRAQRGNEFMGVPALEPERTWQSDLGVTLQTGRLDATLTGFARYHDDYITFDEAPDVPSALPMTPPEVFRYINGKAFFWGGELEMAYALRRGVTLQATGDYLWARDETLDEPAYGVSPASLQLGGRVQPFDDRLFFEANLRGVATQTRVAEARGEASTDGYVLANLRLGLPLPQGLTLRAGIDNLFDTTYADHLNARNQFTRAPILEPGRSVFARLRYAF